MFLWVRFEVCAVGVLGFIGGSCRGFEGPPPPRCVLSVQGVTFWGQCCVISGLTEGFWGSPGSSEAHWGEFGGSYREFGGFKW